MILDTSAVVAILTNEPERREFEELIAASECRLSAVSYLEASIVMLARHGHEAVMEFDAWLETAEVELTPFTAAQARLARRAFLAYGKGRHMASLNFGDCASYALAVDFSEPLLFKGADFEQTDVPSARYM